MTESSRKRVAVILYADIVGYSSKTHSNEASTHKALIGIFDLFQSVVARHEGHIVDFPGDAVLAEFATISGALAAAVEVQDLSVPVDSHGQSANLEFRIGINLGDVIVDRGNIYGDGVNVAERIQRLAPPGGICVSEVIYAAGAGSPLYDFTYWGEHSLKNIAIPIRLYRLSRARMLIDTSARPNDFDDKTFLAAAVFRAFNLDRSLSLIETERGRAINVLLKRIFRSAVAGGDGIIVSEGVDSYVAAFCADPDCEKAIERGVAAILRFQNDITQALEGLPEPPVWSFGVHCGLAIVEREAGTPYVSVHGPVVARASAVVEQSNMPGIFVTEDILPAVRDTFDCTLPDRKSNGADLRTDVWRITPRIGRRGPHTRFVGRQLELMQLQSILHMVAAGGRGYSVHISGEAGIGKTRLTQELSRLCAELSLDVQRVELNRFGSRSGQKATTALLRSFIAACDPDGKNDPERAIQHIVLLNIIPVENLPFILDALDFPIPANLLAGYAALDDQTRQRGKQAAVQEVLIWKAQTGPFVLIIEDVHCADHVEAMFLNELAVLTREHPILLVQTSRDEDGSGKVRRRRFYPNSAVLNLRLGPIECNEAYGIASDLGFADDDSVCECITRARGNPFFLIQLLRHMSLSRTGAMPSTVFGVIKSRLEILPKREREALRALAVAGQRVQLEMLRFVLQQPDYSPEHLLAVGLVADSGDGLVVDHQLTCEVAYQSTTEPLRRSLHSRAAKWFAERDLVLAAEHLEAAKDPSAPAAFFAAAQEQFGRIRFSEALELVQRGLSSGGGQSNTFDLLHLKGRILFALGLVASSAIILRQAIEVAERDAERVEAWLTLTSSLLLLDRYGEALECLGLAEEVAGRANLVKQLACVHYMRGNVHFPLGRVEECSRSHATALGHARAAGCVETEARALSGLGDAEYARGRMRSAQELFRACVTLCTQHGWNRIAAENHHMIASALNYYCPLAAGVGEAISALALARTVAHARAELCCHSCLSVIYFDLGRLDEVEMHVELGQELAKRLGARRFEPLNLTFLAKVHRLRGNQGLAERSIREALKISREIGMQYNGPRVLAEFALVDRSREVGKATLAEGKALLSNGCIGSNHLWFYRDAMDWALRENDFDTALGFAAELDSYTAAEPLEWAEIFNARTRLHVAVERERDPPELVRRGLDLAARARNYGLTEVAINAERLVA